MGERVTYGVFYTTKVFPDDWRIFTNWTTSYVDAKEEAEILLKNPRFKVVIVKRIEAFKTIKFEYVGAENAPD